MSSQNELTSNIDLTDTWCFSQVRSPGIDWKGWYWGRGGGSSWRQVRSCCQHVGILPLFSCWVRRKISSIFFFAASAHLQHLFLSPLDVVSSGWNSCWQGLEGKAGMGKQKTWKGAGIKVVERGRSEFLQPPCSGVSLLPEKRKQQVRNC